jgi:exonuclease SbcD
MKILHTADWHIGRHFHNVSLLEDQRHVIGQILDLIKEEEVEVMIIAGDIYDRSVPPADAVKLLDDTLHTIVNDLGVPVIVISGNHDGPDRLGFASRQLNKAGLYITGPLTDQFNPVLLSDEHGRIAFYPVPYIDPATVRDVFDTDVESFDDATAILTDLIHTHHKKEYADCRSVVVSHCFVAGGTTSESERPLSVGGADQVDSSHFKHFSYAALGHLHQPQSRGAEHIRYAGSLLKYSFSEVEKNKSVTLVDINANGKCTIKELELNPLRDMRIIEGEMEDILAAGKKDPDNQDYLLIRLLDKHAILDPMGKLRTVYPNVLHMEKPNLAQGGERSTLDYEALQKNRLQLFEKFYKEMTSDELAGDQLAYIENLIDHINDDQPGANQ